MKREMQDSQDLNKLRSLAAAVGRFIEWWGFRNIDGRIWAIIYLSSKPVSAPDLVACLGVSKSLVSRGINELLEHGLIVKDTQIERGIQTYTCCEDVGAVVRGVLANREVKMLDDVLIEANALSQAKGEGQMLAPISVDPKKLEQLSMLTKHSLLVLKLFLSTKFSSVKEWIRVLKYAHSFLRKSV